MRSLLLTCLFLVRIPAAAAQTSSIEGRIVSIDGAPAAGVRVAAQVVPDEPAVSVPTVMAAIVETDSAGRFRLNTLLAGRYYIAAGLVDYPTYYPGVKAIGEARIVAVTAGASVTGVEFKLPPPLKVTGRVIRGDSVPAPADQRVTLNGRNRPFESVTPRSDGTFEFTNLIPGDYVIALSTGWSQKNVVVVDKDLDVELASPPLFSVSGRAILEDNAPRPGMFLSLQDIATNLSTSLFPEAVTFNLVLPRGTFRVRAQAQQPGFSVKSMTSGNVDLLRESLVVNGESTPEIVMNLGVSSPPPWVKVSGRVVGSTPTAGARINLSPNAGGETLTAAAGSDGSFEFPRVLTGRYTVQLLSPANSGLAGPPTLAVERTDINNWEILLPAAVDLPGRVVFNGPPPKILRFAWAAPNGGSRGVRGTIPQDDGSFKLTLPEGSTRLSMGSPPIGYVVKSMTYGSVNLLTTDLMVQSGGTSELTVVLEPDPTGKWVSVSGKVSGLPPSSGYASVLLTEDLRDAFLQGTTKSDGSFQFPAVWTGSYSARIVAFPQPALSVTTKRVVPPADLTGLDLKIPVYREAIGQATTVDGDPIRPLFWLNLTQSTSTNTATSNTLLRSDGSFVIRLPEGEWRAEVGGLQGGLRVKSLTYGDADLQKTTASFGAADTRQLKLVLELPATGMVKVSGRVIGAQPSNTMRLTGPVYTDGPIRPDGTFEFASLLPGIYNWRHGDSDGTAITVPEKDLAGLTLRSVKGRVVLEERTAGSNGLYINASDGGGTSSAGMRADGSFTLIVAEGTYRITAAVGASELYVKSIQYGGVDIADQMFTVAPGKEPSDLQIVISRKP